MISDKQLIELFLVGYSELKGRRFRIIEHPDETDRMQQAVDGLAISGDGESLAIEHTLLEPFEGERADAQPFMAAFSNLERDPSLILPHYDVTMIIPAFAIPVGTDWQQVGERVNQWFRDNVARFPDGESSQEIDGLPFPLRLHVEKTSLEDIPGYVFIARSIPQAGVRPVVQRAVHRKLPKLLRTPANTRILLVERREASYGYAHLRTQIEEAMRVEGLEYPNEIWLATTISWDNSHTLWFHEIWPELRRAYFYTAGEGGNTTVRVHVRG
jgi:hypothetical protein